MRKLIRDDLFSLAFLQKSAFTGSYRGMNYRLKKQDDELRAWVFPGPYSFACTDEQFMQSKGFAFSQEGYEEAKLWLEEQYEKGLNNGSSDGWQL